VLDTHDVTIDYSGWTEHAGTLHANNSGSYYQRAETDLNEELEEDECLDPGDVGALVRTAATHVVGLCRARRTAIAACVPVSELLLQQQQQLQPQLQPHMTVVFPNDMKHSIGHDEEGKAAGAGEVQQRGKAQEVEEESAAILGLALDVSIFFLFNPPPKMMGAVYVCMVCGDCPSRWTDGHQQTQARIYRPQYTSSSLDHLLLCVHCCCWLYTSLTDSTSTQNTR
jgi:hypothetical protein